MKPSYSPTSSYIDMLPKQWRLPRDLSAVPNYVPFETSMIYTLVSVNPVNNGESYIGQTIRPKQRFAAHLSNFSKYAPFAAYWELVDIDEVDVVERDRIHSDMPELNGERYMYHAGSWANRRMFPAVREAHEKNLSVYLRLKSGCLPEGSWYAAKHPGEEMKCEYLEY